MEGGRQMVKEADVDVQGAVLELLSKEKKDYVTLNVVRRNLPMKVLRELNLTRKTPLTDFLKKLRPYLGKALREYQGPRTTFIGYSKSLEDLVYDHVNRSSGVSFKQLANALPMKKPAFLETLSSLTGTGRVLCRFRQRDSMPLFHVPEAPPAFAPPKTEKPAKEAPASKGEDDRALFKQAYDQVGKGRGFVRIHRLREKLGWSRERFDSLLLELRNDYTIQLHGGDPSALTEEEIRDSFMDEKGMLFITLTWRGKA
jgi:hypothetical protein